MGTRSKVSSGSEPLKKAIGRPNGCPDTKLISNFSACEAQGNQYEIKIAFFECDDQLINKYGGPLIFLALGRTKRDGGGGEGGGGGGGETTRPRGFSPIFSRAFIVSSCRFQ